ncbi:hypothetical protein FRC09_002623 [Ceratobasidium sp. 395]|nr:hypothetical protein FRC09_002623 [Ceratobasidium sp. 395]
MNPAYKMHEILAALNNVTASTLIIAPSIRKSPFLDMIKEALPTLSSTRAGQDIDEPELPSLRGVFVVDNTGDRTLFKAQMDGIPCAVDLAEVANARYGAEPEEEASILQRMDRHDVLNLQFTSGTTGLPKAVSTFDPKAIVQTVSDERCTALHGVPTHFIGVLEELERRGTDSGLDMSSLRTGIAAGSPVPIDLMRQLIAKMNLRDLTIAYGMTETSPVSFQTTPDDPLETRVETVGRIHPHVRAKIIGQNGELAPIGTAGELCVAGYLVQKGYWMNPEQTNAVMKRDEEDPNILWMHTGDQAVIDEEGYLKITGRIKDLIIRGGENLSPVQIENCLTSHPDIVEAAAIAVPDARFGEVVGVWILLRRGAAPLSQQDVSDWVKVKMNPQNAPTFVWFLGDGDIPSELPKTGSGKIMKNVLREWARVFLAKKTTP